MTSSKKFFYKIVHLVIVYLHTKFYGNWGSFTEVMEGEGGGAQSAEKDI